MFLNKYNLSEADLIGDIAGIPIEIVERMLDHQRYQTGVVDITIFQYIKGTTKHFGGFDWCSSSEGGTFWWRVLYHGNHNEFFNKYPA